jgi:hypothetical protein
MRFMKILRLLIMTQHKKLTTARRNGLAEDALIHCAGASAQPTGREAVIVQCPML